MPPKRNPTGAVSGGQKRKSSGSASESSKASERANASDQAERSSEHAPSLSEEAETPNSSGAFRKDRDYRRPARFPEISESSDDDADQSSASESVQKKVRSSREFKLFKDLVRDFNPFKDDVDAWIRHFEVETSEVTEMTRLAILKSKIYAHCFDWYSNVISQENHQDVQIWLQKLSETYRRTTAHRIEAIRSKVQAEDEAPEVFIRDILKLCLQYNPTMSLEEQITHITDGVHPKYRRAFMSMTHNCQKLQDAETALRVAMKLGEKQVRFSGIVQSLQNPQIPQNPQNQQGTSESSGFIQDLRMPTAISHYPQFMQSPTPVIMQIPQNQFQVPQNLVQIPQMNQMQLLQNAQNTQSNTDSERQMAMTPITFTGYPAQQYFPPATPIFLMAPVKSEPSESAGGSQAAASNTANDESGNAM